MPCAPIGMRLMQWGLLTTDQVEAILTRQREVGRSFGKLAHEMFDVPERDIFRAWADQQSRSCAHVDLACEPNDPSVLRLISAAEAMEHHVLPLRVESGELVCVTTVLDLPEAARLLKARTAHPLRLVLADRAPLERYITRRYDVVEPVEIA